MFFRAQGAPVKIGIAIRAWNCADQVEPLGAVNVINGSYAKAAYRKAIGMLKPDRVAACSTSVVREFPGCRLVIAGAVNPALFPPRTTFSLRDPVRIPCRGRRIGAFTRERRNARYPEALARVLEEKAGTAHAQ